MYCESSETGEIEKVHTEKMAGPTGGPPGLGGFGDVGEARLNFNRMVKGMTRLKEISENVETDQLIIEKYVKELMNVCKEMFMASGSMFEQEHLRFINMFAATGGGGYGGGGGHKFPKGIMEHGVVQYLRAASGDKSFFRQWHQKFTTALGASNQRTRGDSTTDGEGDRLGQGFGESSDDTERRAWR